MSQQTSNSPSSLDWLTISSASGIPAKFNNTAYQLFNNWLIEINGIKYRLLEIEFYYKHESAHNDVYTHGHYLQKTTGSWYFHGSGVDLTCGNEDAYGGILIRSIEAIDPQTTKEKKQYILGPLNVQMELLNNFSPAFENRENSFKLTPTANQFALTPENEIYSCQRFGLSAGKEGGESHYEQHYRYLIKPQLGYKDKTGIAEALLKQKGESIKSYDEIKEIMGSEFFKQQRQAFIQKNSQLDQ